EKTRYSAFTGTNLELKLRERQIEELYLVGVCTDICILHTAIDAYNKGFKIVIPENCVASFDQGAHEWALSHFNNILGAQVIHTTFKIECVTLLTKAVVLLLLKYKYNKYVAKDTFIFYEF